MCCDSGAREVGEGADRGVAPKHHDQRLPKQPLPCDSGARGSSEGCFDSHCLVIQEQEGLVKELTEVLHQNIMINECQSKHCLVIQEQEGLVKELTEVLQRQKTRVAALQKERGDMAAQLASYQPAEQDKLRAEMDTLRERVGQLAGIKARAALQFSRPITMFVMRQCF